MRRACFGIGLAVLTLAGCSSDPKLRDEPVEVTGTVTLPGGAAPKGLTVSFHPQQNTQPGGATVDAGGSFTLKLIPGKYSVYFQDEANAKVPAYKQIPEHYRTPSADHIISVESGKPVQVEVR